MTRINALKISAAAVCLALAGAACGNHGGSPSVAGSDGSTTTSASSALSPPTSKGTSSGGGGSSSGGSLTLAGGNATTMRKFASCMRSHGVPNFPDPNADGSVTFSGVNPDSPSFRHAQDACKKYMPNGGNPPSPAQQAAAQAAALKFSACMRSHGVPKFPDPQFSAGRASLRIGQNSGIDPSSPTFKNAQNACRKDLPGGVQSQKGAP